MKKDEPIAKRLRPFPVTQLESVLSSNVSTFELLPKLEGMALTLPPISRSSTSLEFILNDSFVRMAEKKQHIGLWPKCFDDIVAFLKKVLILMSISLFFHFIPTLYFYNIFLVIQHIFISFLLMMYLQLCEGQDMYFRGQLQKKPIVDPIIVEYPDGLRVPGVSDTPTQFPH
jgi:hypothetical protein